MKPFPLLVLTQFHEIYYTVEVIERYGILYTGIVFFTETFLKSS